MPPLPYPINPDLQAYLASTPVIDSLNPAVSDLAQQLTASLSDDVAKARCLYEWVRDRIPHTSDIDADIITCSASEVLAAQTGICFAKSHLLAALLRAIGIPAGFCYQICADERAGSILHGLNGIYIGSCDRWIRLDPRGNTGSINAQFRLDSEQLAFPPNPALGEHLYPQIWPDPILRITTLLKKFRNRQTLWPYLPTSIFETELAQLK